MVSSRPGRYISGKRALCTHLIQVWSQGRPVPSGEQENRGFRAWSYFLFVIHSFCFRGPCYTCWPLWCAGMVTYQNNCRTCLTAAYCCEMRHRLIFDLLILRCLLFNNAFSTARVTWRRMTGCMCITNGKRRGVLQGIFPAVAGRY